VAAVEEERQLHEHADKYMEMGEERVEDVERRPQTEKYSSTPMDW